MPGPWVNLTRSPAAAAAAQFGHLSYCVVLWPAEICPLFLLLPSRCVAYLCEARGYDSSHRRSVNELLSDLRRVRLGPGGPSQRSLDIQPTVPPAIRNILQLPETPPPRPRRPVRVDAFGRRLPPGPAAPQSWLATRSPTNVASGRGQQQIGQLALAHRKHLPLPDCYAPAPRSLMGIVLRRFAQSWDFQREYCHYYLYDQPSHLRVALISYLGMHTRGGVSVQDLKAILLPPAAEPDCDADDDDDEKESLPSPSEQLGPSVNNADLHHLDLSGSLGRSLKLRELTDFLYPAAANSPSHPDFLPADPKDSWDAPEQPPTAAEASSTIPQTVLPNLTYLSLAIYPGVTNSASWRQLLAFASHCPPGSLTHLSLAYWPEPNLTPNAKLASVIDPSTNRLYQWGDTGLYSHDPDEDWSEAVMILCRLSRILYGLEWLDLSGCGAWIEALYTRVDHDEVDWFGAWGKVEKIRMWDSGDAVNKARILEKHVRAKRMGRGRVIEVDTVTGNK
ncbi:hypothetical protein B0H63DRAFT_557223 [Podospora didyma]|uniref:Tafazzin n=1 Tax=Podospora didyma TaxID=330526 RepID=A0AAE0NYW4_9PEZI|nr:hypothetical protein B0H63DRAFT_557223 [Podospora didyma]